MPGKDSELTIARAALLGLRATLSDASRVKAETIYLLPDMRPMSPEAACDLLARLLKPVTAVAIRRGSAMYFGTWPYNGSDRTDILRLFEEEIAEARSLNARHSERFAHVLLRTEQEDFALSFGECQQLLREYFFPLATVHLEVAKVAEHDRARLILRIGPPAEGTMRA